MADAVGPALGAGVVASSAFVGALEGASSVAPYVALDNMNYFDCLSFVITLLSLVSTNLVAISSTDVYLYLLHLDKILSLIVP